MLDVNFVKVVNNNQQNQLAQMAASIWNEYWPAFIGQAQTDYMVDKFQSLKAIKQDIKNHNYEYWNIEVIDKNKKKLVAGYTGGHPETETDRYFISKIYLFSEFRGCGLCSKIINFYTKLCKERNLEAMYLTVNKNNESAIKAYKRNGFYIIDAVETDIGSGFIMDDYIMEKRVI